MTIYIKWQVKPPTKDNIEEYLCIIDSEDSQRVITGIANRIPQTTIQRKYKTAFSDLVIFSISACVIHKPFLFDINQHAFD